MLWGPYPFVVASITLTSDASQRLSGSFYSIVSGLYASDLKHRFARSEPLDEKSFDTLRQTLLAYIQSEYIYGLAESNAPCASRISWLTTADHLI